MLNVDILMTCIFGLRS